MFLGLTPPKYWTSKTLKEPRKKCYEPVQPKWAYNSVPNPEKKLLIFPNLGSPITKIGYQKFEPTLTLQKSRNQRIGFDTTLVHKGGLRYMYYILVFKLFETTLKNYAVIVGVVKYDKNKNMHHIHNKCKKKNFF